MSPNQQPLLEDARGVEPRCMGLQPTVEPSDSASKILRLLAQAVVTLTQVIREPDRLGSRAPRVSPALTDRLSRCQPIPTADVLVRVRRFELPF